MSSHAEAHGHGEGGHASVGMYWAIGGILAVLTGLEVAAYYMELGSLEIPLLLGLSVVKFVLVVMFFMHLKSDSRIFTWVFMAGLMLAVFVVGILMMLYHVVPGWTAAVTGVT